MCQKQLKRKVINIKTKEPIFEDWLEDTLKSNPDVKKATKACLFWINDSGEYEQADWAYMNMETDDLEYLHKSLGEVLFKRKMEDYLYEHIGDFIEYIE